MIKCKALIQFFDNEIGGMRKKGDIFECSKKRADYLTGDNPSKTKAAEIIEVSRETNEVKEEAKEEKPKKKAKKKIDTKE